MDAMAADDIDGLICVRRPALSATSCVPLRLDTSALASYDLILRLQPPYDAMLLLDSGSDSAPQGQAPRSDSSCLIWLPVGRPSCSSQVAYLLVGRPRHGRAGGSWLVDLPIQGSWCRADANCLTAEITRPTSSLLLTADSRQCQRYGGQQTSWRHQTYGRAFAGILVFLKHAASIHVSTLS
jgi:hypothetical protein